LPQIKRIELFIEFWLADKEDLEKFPIRRFKVRKQPDFLENVSGKVVGFINNQDRRQFLLVTRY
jgi:hypothetical protein